jgi:regulator of cell morphogenesis and NO signaling
MAMLNELMDTKVYQLVTERLTPASEGEQGQPIDMNPALIEQILDLYSKDEDYPIEKMRAFSMEEILNYLQATHRYYLTKKLPEIEQSLVHIFSKYGQSHQLLASLAYFFNAYKENLIAHIRMEEKEFFPYIRQLIALSNNESSNAKRPEKFDIQHFMDSHSPIEDELQEVSTLIKRYSSADEPMPLPYKIFLNQVEIFEIELRKHAIIEDHVLVPMALELEKTFFGTSNTYSERSPSQ